ncbi:MAG: YraN family protein [Oligoflexia bacterium]|nr:YraN family protein [Oligoflexia bacterium]
MNRQKKGRLGEQLAQEFYEALNYQVLARNFRTKFGEVDLIVKNKKQLIFIEVKYRTQTDCMNWDSAYWPKKIARTRILAREFERQLMFESKKYEKRMDIVEASRKKIRIRYQFDLQDAWFE